MYTNLSEVEREQLRQTLKAHVLIDDSGCWIWQRHKRGREKGGGRYGGIQFQKKTHYAHRVAYLVFKGKFDPSLRVLHTCDVPLCINPDHLWLGTQKDNVRDMWRKKRCTHKGEKNSRAKLTATQILEIRALGKQGLTQTAIAKIYGISQPRVSEIILRKLWASVL